MAAGKIELDEGTLGWLRALGLTEAQAEVYAYLLLYTMARGYQPSNRECMARFGWAGTNVLVGFLGTLERKGWLHPGGRRGRAITFLRRLDGGAFRGFACVKGGDDGEGWAAEGRVGEGGPEGGRARGG